MARFRIYFGNRITGGSPPVDDWTTKPIKYYNGSTWVAKPLKYYNGSAWVEKSLKVFV